MVLEKSPILNAIVDGKSVNNRLNFLANNNRTDEYGSIAGGRIIIQAGKEVRLVSGSIDNIRDDIEAMKSRNNVKTVDLYTLDNGTYHSGLRTFDKIFTRDDLLEYWWRKFFIYKIIKTTIAEVSQMRSLGYFFKINKYPSPNIY